MSDTEQYWYNLNTGEVERGFESPAVDRAGPFATAEEASRAPELLKRRSQAWAEEEVREDDCGSRPGSESTGSSDR